MPKIYEVDHHRKKSTQFINIMLNGSCPLSKFINILKQPFLGTKFIPNSLTIVAHTSYIPYVRHIWWLAGWPIPKQILSSCN